MSQFAEQPDRLHPAEGLLDFLPASLTERVAGMARGPAVNRTAALGRVLRHMRRDPHRTDGGDPRRHVEALVAADREAAGRQRQFAEHVQGGIAFGRPRGVRDGRVDDEAMPILGQQVREVPQFGLAADRLLIQAPSGSIVD